MRQPRLRRALLAELTTDEMRLASGFLGLPATPRCPTVEVRCDTPVATLELDCYTAGPRCCDTCFC